MNLKLKLAETKNKLKPYVPVIAGTGIAIVSSAATLAVKILLDIHKGNLLEVTKKDQEVMKTHNVNMCYSIDGEDYALRHLGKTPQED